MKKLLFTVGFLFLFASPTLCWTCSTPGQIRVQVPAGTKGNGQGDGNGQVDTVEGITFQCQDPLTGGDQKQKQKQTQSQNQSQSSNNTNNNSNSNSNTNSSSASANGNGVGNGNNSNDSVTNIQAPKIPVNSAIAPETLPTSPCFKTYSGAGQGGAFGLSIGGGKVDRGCDDRETARLFAVAGNRLAFAKIMCQTPAAIRAKLTLTDCLQATPVPVQPSVPPIAPSTQPTVIIVPAPASVTSPVQLAPVPTPNPASGAKLTEIGTFRMDLTPGSGLCPAPKALVTQQGKIVLDRALHQSGRIIVVGTVRNAAAAFRYLQRNGGSGRVMLKIEDEMNTTVDVSVWDVE